MPDRFINPYTFVPLPRAVQRSVPAGHHTLSPGRVSGELRVTLTAVTPLAIGQDSEQQPDRIDGSSFHGAIRAMHEVLAGGCLRVFNEDFFPTYRDAAIPENTRDYRLARVEEVSDRHVSFRLCESGAEPSHRSGAAWLRYGNVLLDGVTDGDRFRLPNASVSEDSNRRHLVSVPQLISQRISSDIPVAAGQWVIRIADRQAARVTRFAMGRLTADVVPAADPEELMRRYRCDVRGADDLRTGLSEPVPARCGTGPDATELTALRRPTPATLTVGQVVWIQLDRADATGKVVSVKHSLFWRHTPDAKVTGQRVPPALLSCGSKRNNNPGDPLLLCPSCRIFGSIDARGRDEDEEAVQRSYRGHVRVLDLRPASATALPAYELLAPLGSPRPGAGQFYLEQPPGSHRTKPAAREYGSPLDNGSARQLRGRKFYWRTEELNGREQQRPHHSAEVVSRHWIWPAGSTLTGRIVFENLSEAELGALVAAVSPQLLFDEQRVVFPVGGAKPLGLGSARVNIDVVRAWGPDRYRNPRAVEERNPGELVSAFRHAIDGGDDELTNQEIVSEVWPKVSKVLSLDAVDADHIWYPPGGRWSKRGTEEFDEGFAFWRASAGIDVKDSSEMLPLPDVHAPDQSMRIVEP